MSKSRRATLSCWIVLMIAGLPGNILADDPAPAIPFTLNPNVIEQARRTAAAEWANIRDLKSRRPSGLADLDSPEAVSQAIDRAIRQLASANESESELAAAQFRYLGDKAFDALVAGAKSDNESQALHCTWLLGGRGSKALPSVVENLNSQSKRVATAAINSLQVIQDPAAVPALIEALNKEPIRYDVVSLLERFHDPRAIEPLKRFGDTYLYVVEWLQAEQRPSLKLWPADKLPLRQLCLDASTLAGERYGQEEIQKIVELLDSRQPGMVGDAIRALTALHEPSTVPAVIKAIAQFDQARREIGRRERLGKAVTRLTPDDFATLETISLNTPFLFQFFAHVPTENSLEFLVQCLQSPDDSLRHSATAALSAGPRLGSGPQPRWLIPLLIGLLDDPRYSSPSTIVSGRYAETSWNISMPAGNGIYDRLCLTLGRFGLEGRIVGMTDKHTNVLADNFRIADEIARLKTWWQTHGEDFLQGKKVPNPGLLYITPGLK